MKEIRIQLFDHSQGSKSLLRTKFVRDKEEAIEWATKLLKYDYPSLHDEFIRLSEGKTPQERMSELTRIGYLEFKFHDEET